MKQISIIKLTLISAAFLAACGGFAANAQQPINANTNTNATKTKATAPTAEALMAFDKQANEAYMKGDGKFFDRILSDKFVMNDGGDRFNKAAVVDMMSRTKCESKSFELTEPQMATIDADTYVLIYKGTFDGSCTGPDGTSMKIPSPIRAATVWIRNGDKWQAAFHGENLIVDPKNLPKTAPPPPAKPANKEDAAKPATPLPDANTDALVKIELRAWEAWRIRDAKKLEDLTANNLSFIDIFGNSYGNKADTIKAWSGAICDVKSVSVTGGVASALSPTVELLTHTGAADGTCYGQKVGAVHGNSIYVKNGNTWKLAFTMNMPAM